jgi:hypothetical protein
MLDRRQDVRNKVIFGGVAGINESGSTMDCVVRNSEHRARVEVDSTARLPDEMSRSIPRKGRSFLAQVIWRQANRVGLAFWNIASGVPASDLDERLRKSEEKKRQLQRRIKQLLES